MNEITYTEDYSYTVIKASNSIQQLFKLLRNTNNVICYIPVFEFGFDGICTEQHTRHRVSYSGFILFLT